MANLTDVQLRHWIRERKVVAKADGHGLTFTLSPGGTPTWVLRYRFGEKPRELTIGRYPDIGLAKAREIASDERGLMVLDSLAGEGPPSEGWLGKVSAQA